MKQLILLDTHDLITLLRGARVRLPVDTRPGWTETILELDEKAATDARQVALQLSQDYKAEKKGGTE